MNQEPLITTSWDDGHPMDLKLAELLAANGIPATLYIPRRSQLPTMEESQIRDLAEHFEIGAHTMNHVTLDEVDPATAQREIIDSKKWVEDVIGKPCRMFCPPLGHYLPQHLEIMRQAGFIGFRTVEMMSLCPPRNRGGLWEMPTTIQAFSHQAKSILKNALKRRRPGNFFRHLLTTQGPNWPAQARALLQSTIKKSGIFHLWGHSWELQTAQQWEKVKAAIEMLGEYKGRVKMMSNGEICASCR